MKDLSLVIPVYNEESILVSAVNTIVCELKKIEKLNSFELIIVDDGSQDGTWQLLSGTLCSMHAQIRAVKLSRNFGKESALCAGLEQADAKAIVVMDADLQHPPALINDMYKLWREGGVDVVEAVKRSRGNEPFFSRLAAKVFYAIFSFVSGTNLQNASDFKLLDKRVVDAWKEMPEKNLFFRGMSAWLGFERKQILFDVADRTGGNTKWSTFSLVKFAFISIAAFSAAPLHLITMAGIVFLVFSLLLGTSTLVQYFTGVAVSGFTTVILLLLIIGGAIMIALGIIGEYLARIYDEVKNRPRFLVSERASGNVKMDIKDSESIQ